MASHPQAKTATADRGGPAAPDTAAYQGGRVAALVAPLPAGGTPALHPGTLARNPTSVYPRLPSAVFRRLGKPAPGRYFQFETYRDLGPRRTLKEAGALLGNTPEYLSLVSREWHWQMQCAAWDREQSRARTEGWMQCRKAAVENQLAVADALLGGR